MLEKPNGAIKNGQFRDTSNIGYKTQNENYQNKKQKQKKQKKHRKLKDEQQNLIHC